MAKKPIKSKATSAKGNNAKKNSSQSAERFALLNVLGIPNAKENSVSVKGKGKSARKTQKAVSNAKTVKTAKKDVMKNNVIKNSAALDRAKETMRPPHTSTKKKGK